jgi:hypothetical protein
MSVWSEKRKSMQKWIDVEELTTSFGPSVEAVEKFLDDRKEWPTGLKKSVVSELNTVAKRFFILDNSSSMSSGGGEIVERTHNESNGM